MPETPAIKAAATLLLLKEGLEQPEFFMVKRHHQIDVASGALVFPGGKVDAQDSDPDLLATLTNHRLAGRLLPFAVAIIREVFEETGILYARRKQESALVSARHLAELSHYRHKLVNEEITLKKLLHDEELVLALDQLWHFAHWITPAMAPKRFDTHFFIAKAPEDQVAIHDGSESVDSVWIDPHTLMAEADQGKWKLVFPTRMNIEKLARFSNMEAIKTYLESHTVVSVQPEFREFDGGKFLCLPEEADYPQTRVAIEKVMNP